MTYFIVHTWVLAMQLCWVHRLGLLPISVPW